MEGIIKTVLNALHDDNKLDDNEQEIIKEAMKDIVEPNNFSQLFVEVAKDGRIEMDEYNQLVGVYDSFDQNLPYLLFKAAKNGVIETNDLNRVVEDFNSKDSVRFARKFLKYADDFIDEDVETILELEKKYEMELSGFKPDHIEALKETLSQLPVSFTKGVRVFSLDRNDFKRKCLPKFGGCSEDDNAYVPYLHSPHTFIHEMAHVRILINLNIRKEHIFNPALQEKIRAGLDSNDIMDGEMLLYEWSRTGENGYYAEDDGKNRKPFEYGEIYFKKLELLLKYGLLPNEVFENIVNMAGSDRYINDPYIDDKCNEDRTVCSSINFDRGASSYGISSGKITEDICDMLAYCYSAPAHVAGLIRNCV